MTTTNVELPAAPPRSRVEIAPRSLRADLTLVGISALFSQALGVVTSLALRAWLDPAAMGIWQALKLILSYSNYANLGASKGAARELSLALGRGDIASASTNVGHALSVNTVASAVVAAGLVAAGAGVAAWGSGAYAATWAWALAATGLLVLVQRHVTYLVTLLRASQRFDIAARITLCESVLTLVVAVGGVVLWGLPGLLVSTAVVLLATWAIARRALPFELRWTWDRHGAAQMIHAGGPMLAAGALSSLLRSLDKLAILVFLADREYQLGVYSLALLVTTQIHGLTNLLGGVLLPRFTAEYGRLGCERQVARQVVTATQALAPIVAAGCVAGLFLGGPLLGALLPEYRAGLPPLVALLPGCAAIALAVPLAQYQMAVGDERRALTIVAAATLLTAALDAAVMIWMPGLVALAAATSVGYLVYFVATLAGSLWGRLDAVDRRRYAQSLTLVVAIPLTGAWLVSVSLDANAWLPRAIALAVSVAWIAGSWWALRPRAPIASLNWEEFERRCQKPDHRRIGSWLARRVARPAALRITWLVIPWGVSAHATTLLAWAMALAAALCLATGSAWGWLAAAALLQVWYLLDHVDGQLARWHGTASLDGVALDYLMHHAVTATTWFAVGWGVAAARGQAAWIAVGAAAALALLLGGLLNDVRYKAFFQRLKRVQGRLEVVNQRGAGAAAVWPEGAVLRLARAIRASLQTHVAMCVLGFVALSALLLGDGALWLGAAWLGASALAAVALLALDVARNLGRGAAEEEFARWFVPPPGHELTFDEGWYRVQSPGTVDADP